MAPRGVSQLNTSKRAVGKHSALARVPKVAVVTLALWIGAATAVVTVAEALLLRPMPVASEGRLAVLHGATTDGTFPNVPLTFAELIDYQSQSRVLDQVACWSGLKGP